MPLARQMTMRISLQVVQSFTRSSDGMTEKRWVESAGIGGDGESGTKRSPQAENF
jgi:hypothetical protein